MAKVMLGNVKVGASLSVIVGATVNGKVNYMTLGQYSGLSMNPPMLYISSRKVHYTNAGIKENGYFSVNIPSNKLILKMDYVGFFGTWALVGVVILLLWVVVSIGS